MRVGEIAAHIDRIVASLASIPAITEIFHSLAQIDLLLNLQRLQVVERCENFREDATSPASTAAASR